MITHGTLIAMATVRTLAPASGDPYGTAEGCTYVKNGAGNWTVTLAREVDARRILPIVCPISAIYAVGYSYMVTVGGITTITVHIKDAAGVDLDAQWCIAVYQSSDLAAADVLAP